MSQMEVNDEPVPRRARVRLNLLAPRRTRAPRAAEAPMALHGGVDTDVSVQQLRGSVCVVCGKPTKHSAPALEGQARTFRCGTCS